MFSPNGIFKAFVFQPVVLTIETFLNNLGILDVWFHLQFNIIIYYIKVSGIPSGKKLIKTIRYPHM